MQSKELYGATFNAVKTGLTGISGAATTFSTGATALQYCIGGKAYTKAQVAGGATPTTDIVTGAAFKALAANQACAVVWMLDKSGNVKCAQSTIITLDSGGNYESAPLFPDIDLDTYCPIAYTLHQADNTASAWTFGSSNWNATGLTHVVQDLLTMPTRPQTS